MAGGFWGGGGGGSRALRVTDPLGGRLAAPVREELARAIHGQPLVPRERPYVREGQLRAPGAPRRPAVGHTRGRGSKGGRAPPGGDS